LWPQFSFDEFFSELLVGRRQPRKQGKSSEDQSEKEVYRITAFRFSSARNLPLASIKKPPVRSINLTRGFAVASSDNLYS
jgi:hypothetical protein